MKTLKLLIKWVIIINLWSIGVVLAILILVSNISLLMKILMVITFLVFIIERQKRKKKAVQLQINTNNKLENTNIMKQTVATKIEHTNETREKLEFLNKSVNTGEIISIKYYGGTHYGAIREVVPRRVEGDKLRAYCCIDNIEKTFFIDKMAILNEAGEIIYNGQIDITNVVDDDDGTPAGLSLETQVKVAAFTIFFIIGAIMSLIGIFSRPILISGIAFIVISILCCFVKTGTGKK